MPKNETPAKDRRGAPGGVKFDASEPTTCGNPFQEFSSQSPLKIHPYARRGLHNLKMGLIQLSARDPEQEKDLEAVQRLLERF